jgi:hypothetical protein
MEYLQVLVQQMQKVTTVEACETSRITRGDERLKTA